MPRVPIRIGLLAVALLAAAAVPARAASVPPNFMGVVVDDGSLLSRPALLAGEAKVMHGIGVRSVRVPVYWPEMQASEKAPIDFRALDATVAALAGARLQVLPVPVSSPTWDAVDPANAVNPFVSASAPARYAPYARFVAALARRYGTRGTFWGSHPKVPRIPITQWQIWNEPSLVLFWAQQPFQKAYVALLRATRPALKAADPKARIILAGLPNNSWTQLRRIYAAGGRGLFDEVAVHPYSKTPARVLEIIRRTRLAMTDNHDGALGMQVTEMGYSSGGTSIKPPADVTWNTNQAGQARDVTNLYTALAANRARFHIDAAYWFSWYTPETPKVPQRWESFTGLRNNAPNGTLRSKPALGAYAKIAHQLEG